MEYRGEEKRSMLPQCQVHNAETNAAIKLINENIEMLAKNSADIKKMLVGNGKLGLCGKVEVLWKNNKYLYVSIGGLVITMIGLIFKDKLFGV